MESFKLGNREASIPVAVKLGKLGLQLRAHFFRRRCAVSISVEHLHHAASHAWAHHTTAHACAHHACAHHVSVHALHHVHHSAHVPHHTGTTVLHHAWSALGAKLSPTPVVGVRECGTAKGGCSQGHCSE